MANAIVFEDKVMGLAVGGLEVTNATNKNADSFNCLSAVEVLGKPKVSNKQSRNPRCVYTHAHAYYI